MEAAGYSDTSVSIKLHGVISQKAAGVIFNSVRTADLSVLPNITRGLGLRWIQLAQDGYAATLVNTALRVRVT
jgi:hypothetical protein